jgi:hypothetical protein
VPDLAFSRRTGFSVSFPSAGVVGIAAPPVAAAAASKLTASRREQRSARDRGRVDAMKMFLQCEPEAFASGSKKV